jgi:hypothetical protein
VTGQELSVLSALAAAGAAGGGGGAWKLKSADDRLASVTPFKFRVFDPS